MLGIMFIKCYKKVPEVSLFPQIERERKKKREYRAMWAGQRK
jgi:hypothetical protein